MVTFDLRYTPTMPPTAPPGTLPRVEGGGYVAVAIDEADPTNRVVWDTSRVPAGSYVLWAVPTEEPPDLPITLVTFSPGVVTVAHPGDPIHPAVALPWPDRPFVRARGVARVPLHAFDPTGTASVTLSASARGDGTGFFEIARALPARSGTVSWELGAVPPGSYTLRAEISDARGLRFVAFARHFLEVDAPEPDAGAPGDDASGAGDAPSDDARIDASAPGPRDAGPAGPDAAPPDAAPPDAGAAEEGASCGATRAGGWSYGALALTALHRSRRRRRRA